MRLGRETGHGVLNRVVRVPGAAILRLRRAPGRQRGHLGLDLLEGVKVDLAARQLAG